MQNAILLLTVMAVLPSFAIGQPVDGFGIEAIASVNTLTYHRLTITRIQPAQDFPFNDLALTYGGRVFYRHFLLNHVTVQPFLQHGQLGGKRTSDDPAEYILRHWSMGAFVSYTAEDVEVGLTYRASRLIDPTFHVFSPDSAGASMGRWLDLDVARIFKNWYHDGGIRAAYRIARWSVAGEAWFPLSRMESDVINDQADFTQNQYAISIGYVIFRCEHLLANESIPATK